jgi:hypothetical protein
MPLQGRADSLSLSSTAKTADAGRGKTDELESAAEVIVLYSGTRRWPAPHSLARIA